MNYGCENKVVVITGGTSGIGRACALALAAEGAKVFVLARHVKKVAGCEFVACDVTQRKSVEGAFAQVAKKVGNIDILINSAGVYTEQMVERHKDKDYDILMDTNVRGTVLACQYALQHMNGGSIVNVASDAGIRGNYGCALYSASKGAVVAFSRSLALDVAPAVRVNCVCPADVDTPLMRKQCAKGGYKIEDCVNIYPLGRIAKPEEIAHVICAVASPANGFMTGVVIPVTGGL